MNNRLLIISKALCDETRFNIIKLLLGGSKCVCEIIPYIKKAQPTVSLQLKKLENWDLIESQKQGKKVFYSIKDKMLLELFDLFDVIK